MESQTKGCFPAAPIPSKGGKVPLPLKSELKRRQAALAADAPIDPELLPPQVIAALEKVKIRAQELFDALRIEDFDHDISEAAKGKDFRYSASGGSFFMARPVVKSDLIFEESYRSGIKEHRESVGAFDYFVAKALLTLLENENSGRTSDERLCLVFSDNVTGNQRRWSLEIRW